MNWRLLEPHEVEENRRGRVLRRAGRQARMRRQHLLMDMAIVAGLEAHVIASLLSPQEILVLLTGHLNAARHISARVSRALRIAPLQRPEARTPPSQHAPERPRRVLQRRNRGSNVDPSLLLKALPVENPMALTDTLLMAAQHANAGATVHLLLDFFVRAAGLSWESSAAILRERRITPEALSPADILATRHSRAFLCGFHEARIAYTMAVAAQEVPAMAGDWALLEAAQLQTILPGLRVPTLLQRPTYLVNLVAEPRGLCLDLHVLSGLPLVRHPL